MLILIENIFRCLCTSMKFLFSLKMLPKAARVIKGDDTRVFLAKQPRGSHKQKMILSLTNTDTTAALDLWPLPIYL